MNPDPVEELPVEETEGRLVSPREGGAVPTRVVGVGASAGGLEAYTKLLAHLPENTGMAFLLVQHLDPQHASQLTEILSRYAKVPVVEARDGMSAEPDRIYVIPPNATMRLSQGVLQLSPRTETSGQHMPIDQLFRSLAAERGTEAIGVILSGTGSDGTLGMEAIKSEGGITFAQDDSAKFDAMPHSAIANGCVDLVLPPEGIAGELVKIGSRPDSLQRTEEMLPVLEEDFRKLFGVIQAHCGIDFSAYKRSTLIRRIGRRMTLSQTKLLSDYVAAVEGNPGEVEALCQDLLIRVTGFFRDPESFQALGNLVFPALLKDRAPTDAIRVWVPGCSTGEEVYSLAICLTEFLERTRSEIPFQVFGTDINAKVIDRARKGSYIENVALEVPGDRLQRFFTKTDGRYQIVKSIRDLCVFAKQDLTTDPPFSRLDLVSCRNVLIYLESAYQKRIISVLHYSMKPAGFLMLGSAETVGGLQDQFRLLDAKHKVYAKKDTPGHHIKLDWERRRSAKGLSTDGGGPAKEALDEQKAQREADRIVLSRFSPPGVLIDEDMNILQFRGRTAPYLEPQSGEPSFHLLKMAPPGLLADLVSTVRQAAKDDVPLRKEGLRVPVNGGFEEFGVEVIPVRVPGTEARRFLVLFESARPERKREASPPPAESMPAGEAEAAQLIANLRKELSSLREFLQSVIEERENAVEELQSANEEILASNEEFQSTNEELETAKEELQSTIEEVTTVNEELKNRNQELGQLNSDLSNLLLGVQVPLVVLGPDLTIRRFTPLAEKVFALGGHDVGRPIGAVRSHLTLEDLGGRIAQVLASGRADEGEVQDHKGCWYEMHIRPHTVTAGRVDGILLAFFDIDFLKRIERDLQEAKKVAETANASKDRFLAALSHELRTPLTPVLMSIGALEEREDLPADLREDLRVIRREIDLEARLVDDLLDLTRIARGKVELRRETVDVHVLLDHIVERYCKSEVNQKGVSLEIRAEASEHHVLGDLGRLQQVFWNIIRNSVKFTPEGGWIGIRTGTREPGRMSIEVTDTGIGIKRETMERLFNAFEQGGSEVTRRYGGLGMGLAISKSIVELHGGTITARSPGSGLGSTFVVELPTTKVEGGVTKAEERQSGERARERPATPLRILLVDDHVGTTKILARLLGSEGHQVAVSHDIASAKRRCEEQRLDLVICDLGLPDGNGLELMRYLKERTDVQGIALSGYGMDEDIRRSREAGFAEHLTKPVDLRQLLAAIARLPVPSEVHRDAAPPDRPSP